MWTKRRLLKHTKKPDGAQHVGDDHGLEHVELEVSVAGADGAGHVVAHHLRRDHRQRLALCGVHLAWDTYTAVTINAILTTSAILFMLTFLTHTVPTPC